MSKPGEETREMNSAMQPEALVPKATELKRMKTLAAALLGALLALGGFDSASADPPCWAPAHGQRAKYDDDDCRRGHKRKYKHKHKHSKRDHRRYRDYDDDDGDHGESWSRAEPAPTAGPSPQASDTGGVSVGGLVGAAVGGYLGSQVGSGDGKLAATAGGTLGGYLVGQEIERQSREGQ
jgi:hypothetical protein